MKFNQRTETLHEKVMRWKKECKPYHDYYRNWHKWFAWYPVPISSTEKVWLQFVERRYTWGNYVIRVVYDPIYRELPFKED